VLGLGGPGGWYVPVRAKAIYEGTDDVGEVLAAQAGLAALPLATLYVEGSEDPYILLAYLRDANVLENCLKRLADFYESLGTENMRLALPAPTDWTADEFSEEAEFEVVDMEPESRADAALPALSDQRTAEINEDLEARTPVEPSVGFREMPDLTVTNFAEDDARYRAGFSPDNPDPQQVGLDGRRKPVVLPFSRGALGTIATPLMKRQEMLRMCPCSMCLFQVLPHRISPFCGPRTWRNPLTYNLLIPHPPTTKTRKSLGVNARRNRPMTSRFSSMILRYKAIVGCHNCVPPGGNSVGHRKNRKQFV
jgi:hypothetical protein